MNEIETVLAAMGYTPAEDAEGYWHPPAQPFVWVHARMHVDAAFVEKHLLPWLHSKGVSWAISQNPDIGSDVWVSLIAHRAALLTERADTLTEAVLKAVAQAVDAGWFAE